MGAIITEGLTKHYGRRVGIESLSLNIPAGTVFGFLGPNGAGKTTMIRLLLGLLRPTEGSAQVLGMDAWRESHRLKAEVGYLPGDLRLYPWMTAQSALEIFGQVRRRDILGQGIQLCERFQLETDVLVRSMSRGMRQKLGLILALAHCPKLLILDEPTSSLDPPMQQELYDYLRERAAAGVTVFFSSHTLSEVEGLCDIVAILREGRLVAHEGLDALRERAKRTVTLRWAGESAARSPVPDFLEIVSRTELDWNCTLSGPVMDLLRWSANQPLTDMGLGKPDLDSLFHEFYHRPGDTK